MRQLRRFALVLAIVAVSLVVGLGAAASRAAGAVAPTCKTGYYKNVSGHCVRRPARAPSVPAGATAKCRDGTYSFSEHASGTCSHHGGVGIWIHHP